MSKEIGPVSQAILDHVNRTPGPVKLYKMRYEVAGKTGDTHAKDWYFRRLVALALEGHIEGRVYRDGDDVAIRFRRLQEAEA